MLKIIIFQKIIIKINIIKQKIIILNVSLKKMNCFYFTIIGKFNDKEKKFSLL
jgi:hypothetical protein